MSVIKPLLRDVLHNLIKHLTEDEALHFKKIHVPIKNMSKKSLIAAIQLVERTLESNGIDYFAVVQESLGKINIDN